MAIVTEVVTQLEAMTITAEHLKVGQQFGDSVMIVETGLIQRVC